MIKSQLAAYINLSHPYLLDTLLQRFSSLDNGHSNLLLLTSPRVPNDLLSPGYARESPPAERGRKTADSPLTPNYGTDFLFERAGGDRTDRPGIQSSHKSRCRRLWHNLDFREVPKSMMQRANSVRG
jgi:hypothetical protein